MKPQARLPLRQAGLGRQRLRRQARHLGENQDPPYPPDRQAHGAAQVHRLAAALGRRADLLLDHQVTAHSPRLRAAPCTPRDHHPLGHDHRHEPPPRQPPQVTSATRSLSIQTGSKQTKAARQNVSKAQEAAASKRTIAHMPKRTRTALGQQGAAVARRKRTGGDAPKTRAGTLRDRQAARPAWALQDGTRRARQEARRGVIAKAGWRPSRCRPDGREGARWRARSGPGR